MSTLGLTKETWALIETLETGDVIEWRYHRRTEIPNVSVWYGPFIVESPQPARVGLHSILVRRPFELVMELRLDHVEIRILERHKDPL